MISYSNQLLDLAHKFASCGKWIDERVDSLILGGVFQDSAEQVAWLSLVGKDLTPFRSLQIYDQEIQGDLDPSDSFDGARVLTITIAKPTVAGVAPFVFSQSAAAFLEAGQCAGKVLSHQLEPRAAFWARGLEVAHWDISCPIASPAVAVSINPQKLVRDYVSGREITNDLSPWIIAAAPAVESSEYLAWRKQASRRLLGGLVNSALQECETVLLQASGPPMFRIKADDISVPDAIDQLTAGAQWVFLQGSDVEVRHLIFATEIARAARSDTSLAHSLDRALESARTTYEAHVQSASRETLKALADLRKTVIDETQKVTQRAQDLTAGLWRDVAVSAAPFMIKVLGDATKASSVQISAGFYFAAAVFIALSFIVQSRINQTHFSNQKNARDRWLATLYTYISERERSEIAETPINNALKSYRETWISVGAINLTLIVILCSFGYFTTLTHPDSQTTPLQSETKLAPQSSLPPIHPENSAVSTKDAAAEPADKALNAATDKGPVKEKDPHSTSRLPSEVVKEK